MLNVILMQPEIPPNTGNIARTCAATGTRLHLIEPLGFELSDRYLKRAGLDYWHLLDWTVYPDLAAFCARWPQARPWMLTTKSTRAYTDIAFESEDWLMFGCETRGLPADLLGQDPARTARIPMLPTARSLNLGNAVAIVLFEALRQRGFPGLSGLPKPGRGEPNPR